MKRNIWIGIGVAIVVALAIVLVTQTKKEVEEIKIGVINSLTGSGAPYCENLQNALLLAVKEINKAGCVKGRKIKLIIEDDKTSPTVAVSAMNKLVNVDKVPIIIGPASSSSVMACAPIANRTKTVLLSPGAASPNITTAGDFIFRNRASGAAEGVEIAKFAYKKLGLRKVAILYINTDYGPGFSKAFKTKFTQLGVKIVGIETYNQGATDFRTQITKLKKLKPDGVYLVGVPIEAGNILKQSLELGFTPQFLTNNMESPELIKIAGKAAEGIFFAIPAFDPNSPNPKVQEFVKKYRAKYGREPDMFAVNAYDAVYLIKLAIEKAGYNGEDIKNALYDIKDFPGVNGTLSFDENGDVVKPLTIKTIEHGKFVVVK